jgi:hypothetical protein
MLRSSMYHMADVGIEKPHVQRKWSGPQPGFVERLTA